MVYPAPPPRLQPLLVVVGTAPHSVFPSAANYVPLDGRGQTDHHPHQPLREEVSMADGRAATERRATESVHGTVLRLWEPSRASYWFVGMEEGGGRSLDEVARRLAAWDERGRRPLEDLRDYHLAIRITGHFVGAIKLQRTWAMLIQILSGLLESVSRRRTSERSRRIVSVGPRMRPPCSNCCHFHRPHQTSGRTMNGLTCPSSRPAPPGTATDRLEQRTFVN